MFREWCSKRKAAHQRSVIARKRPKTMRRPMRFEALDERAVLSALPLGGLPDHPSLQQSGTFLVAEATRPSDGMAAPSALDANVVDAAVGINDPPMGTDEAATIVGGAAHTFTTADFGFSDPNDSPPNNFHAVVITSAPIRGSLTLRGAIVHAGQSISVDDINAGQLMFTTPSNASGSPYADFQFQVQDDGGTLGGGVDTDQSPNTFTLFVVDARTNFVRGLYLDVLGRQPDAGGLGHWVALLNQGVSSATVAKDFWESPEHRGIQVDGYYQQFLHRNADQTGRQFWIDQMQHGATEEKIMAQFATTTEYMLNHASNTSFVDGLYNDVLSRAPDADGEAFWIDALASGRLTRGQVVQSFIDTHERHLNLVDSYYQHFLGRPADPDGRSFWSGQLDQKALGDAGVAEALLATPEYFTRLH